MVATAFEFIPHTADIQFKTFGASQEEALAHCVNALSHVLARGRQVESTETRTIRVSGGDSEEVLYKLLDELIFLFDSDGFLPVSATITLDLPHLVARVQGDDATHYDDLDHVKAATYHDMYVKEVRPNEWEAQVVLDV